MPTDHDFDHGFEYELGDALRDAAELTPEPLTHLLTAGAQEHGRRWRRRRRTALASGCAALVIVGAGGSMALGHPGGAAGPSGSASPTVVPMSQDQVVGLVTGLLPPGKVSVLVAGGTGEGKLPGHEYRAGGTLMFDDGAGASIFTYTVDRTDLAPEVAAVCMDGFTMPQDSCVRTPRPDGSVVVIDELRSTTTPGGREWRATWAAPDGRRVAVIEYNGQPAVKDRENPPLSAEQLTALVTAPAWERVFAALPPLPTSGAAASPVSTPERTGTGPGTTALLAELVSVLPAGATSAPAPAHESNQADLTVTLDGRTSMLQVGDEPPSAQGIANEKSVENGVPTPLEVHRKLPDGTLVVTNQTGNGKTATDPILHWTAEAYYPDGRHVSLAEWNGENGYTARPGTPALSTDQLEAIVTDPHWRS